MAPTTRLGVVRAVVNANAYTVTIGNATVTAHFAGTTPKVRGAAVRVRFDPEKRFWSIEG